jgi:hypothetical protein
MLLLLWWQLMMLLLVLLLPHDPCGDVDEINISNRETYLQRMPQLLPGAGLL